MKRLYGKLDAQIGSLTGEQTNPVANLLVVIPRGLARGGPTHQDDERKTQGLGLLEALAVFFEGLRP